MSRRTSSAVYILTTRKQTVLYVGVTSNLARRLTEHRSGAIRGFTKRYNVDRLVWYEWHDDIRSAIVREKQIKAGGRAAKVALIDVHNPEWKDLAGEIDLA